MTNNQMTVKFWAELNDNQSENLNGGYRYAYTSLNVNIAGGVGAFQQNGDDGTQVNLIPIGKAPVHRYFFW